MIKKLKRIISKMSPDILFSSKKNYDHHNYPFPVPERCPVCGASSFTKKTILYDSIVEEWGLNSQQRDYLDLQQGLVCNKCQSNLRSMTLAYAILLRLQVKGTFAQCCLRNKKIRDMRILEINEAGNLSGYLQKTPNHLLATYPEYDMQQLSLSDGSFDMVIHSDTLEHVPNSIQALQECRRVLAPGGFLAYTIPITPERLTRSREGLPPSYHGKEGDNLDDCLVYREYGSDFWCELLEANFRNIHVYCLIYPASLAVLADCN